MRNDFYLCYFGDALRPKGRTCVQETALWCVGNESTCIRFESTLRAKQAGLQHRDVDWTTPAQIFAGRFACKLTLAIVLVPLSTK